MSKQSKARNYNKIYKQLRIKNETSFTFNFILQNYGVESEYLRKQSDGNNDKSVLIGFDTNKLESFITDFVNNGWEIISVSEDSNSICFHLLADEDD